MSLALPWEVIERVIDHSSDSVTTLYSFTLTCRQLNPRSTMLLLGRIALKTRDQLFSLCDVLRDRPHLQPVVRSITIPPNEFSPHPLLRMLHNLSEIELATPRTSGTVYPMVTFHASVLKCCRQLGEHIQRLSLERIDFPSLPVFSEILLSFRRIRALSCSHMKIFKDGINQELISQRLSEQMRLHAFSIGVASFVSETALLLLGQIIKHTVTNLVFTNPDLFESQSNLHGFLGPSPSSSWAKLASLTLKIDVEDSAIAVQQALETFSHFRPAKLREVTIDFNLPSVAGLLQFLCLVSQPNQSLELESALLSFPQLELRFSLRYPVNTRKDHSWRGQIEMSLPMFARRHALTFEAESSGKVGHDSRIRTRIATSTNGQWATTGSADDTIIIWDLRSGSILHEWLVRSPQCHSPTFMLKSLAFSPDCRYIALAGALPGVTLWDLHCGACSIVLQGNDNVARECMWSADGAVIAAGFWGNAVYVWETNIFHRLHPNQMWSGELLSLSPDGHWLMTGVSGGCRLWNVASGHLQWARRCHNDKISTAAFDPEGVRVIARSSGNCTIHVWSVETGEELLILQEPIEEASSWAQHNVAYSPDGGLILSWPSTALGAANVWDAASGDLRARLGSPDRAVLSACFSPCSRYVASASEEGAALLWRTSDGACIAKVSEDGSQVDHVAISPDGEVLCCGATDGTMFFRSLRSLVRADERSYDGLLVSQG